MAQIDALQAEHALTPPPEYHYRYARVWNAVANWERSQAAASRNPMSRSSVITAGHV